MSVKLTPSQTVRAQCVECLGLMRWDRGIIKNCQGNTCLTGQCPLYPYRMGKRISVKVFRRFCLHCMGGQVRLVAECPSVNCKIYPYRMGRNPSLIGIGRGGNTAGIEALRKYAQNRRVSVKSRRESMTAGHGI